jgi:hypothetical protein
VKSSNANQAKVCERNNKVISKYDRESIINILPTEPGLWLTGATARELINRQASYYEDGFPLEFDTGFTLFVTAICIVGFLYAVWAAIYTKVIWCGHCAFIAATSAV